MPALLFTENETNFERLFGVPNPGPFVKDAFHEAIVGGRTDKVNPRRQGTKAAAHYQASIAPGGCSGGPDAIQPGRCSMNPFGDFDAIVERRIAETDEFYRVDSTAGTG